MYKKRFKYIIHNIDLYTSKTSKTNKNIEPLKEIKTFFDDFEEEFNNLIDDDNYEYELR